MRRPSPICRLPSLHSAKLQACCWLPLLARRLAPVAAGRVHRPGLAAIANRRWARWTVVSSQDLATAGLRRHTLPHGLDRAAAAAAAAAGCVAASAAAGRWCPRRDQGVGACAALFQRLRRSRSGDATFEQRRRLRQHPPGPPRRCPPVLAIEGRAEKQGGLAAWPGAPLARPQEPPKPGWPPSAAAGCQPPARSSCCKVRCGWAPYDRSWALPAVALRHSRSHAPPRPLHCHPPAMHTPLGVRRPPQTAQPPPHPHLWAADGEAPKGAVLG